jgi:hypothetical protein
MLKLAGLCRGGDSLALDSHPCGQAPGRVRRLPLTPAPEMVSPKPESGSGSRPTGLPAGGCGPRFEPATGNSRNCRLHVLVASALSNVCCRELCETTGENVTGLKHGFEPGLVSRLGYAAVNGRPGGPLSPEGSALQREPQILAHQVADPVGATRLFLLRRLRVSVQGEHPDRSNVNAQIGAT